MSARANQQQANDAAATKRAARTQGARGNKTKKNDAAFADERRVNPGRRKEDRAKVSGEAVRKGKNTDKKALTIGGFVGGMLLHGKSTEEILKAVAKKFPDSHTSAASVAWYRSKLNKQGKH